MRLAALFLPGASALTLLAASVLHFNITDARGKRPAGVSIEARDADFDGWYDLKLKVDSNKIDPVLIWPFDEKAAAPDGPEPVPAIAIQRGDQKALANAVVLAAMATPVVLGVSTLAEIARRTGFNSAALSKLFASLTSASDPFAKGVGLLYAQKPFDAVDPLALALRERQRQLTRVPSEIYPLAMLEGRALILSNKFDQAAVAFLTASKLRPSDASAQQMRAEALIKAGKPEAAKELKKR